MEPQSKLSQTLDAVHLDTSIPIDLEAKKASYDSTLKENYVTDVEVKVSDQMVPLNANVENDELYEEELFVVQVEGEASHEIDAQPEPVAEDADETPTLNKLPQLPHVKHESAEDYFGSQEIVDATN